VPHGRNFRLLILCNVISVTGSGFSGVAIPFAVLRVGGTVSDVGYVATAGLIPLIACLLLGGVVADRMPRHRVISTANAVQALVQGTSATLLLTGEARVWQLAVLGAAAGAAFGFYLPAASGLLPQTVAPGERQAANAINRAGGNLAAICGAALGGIVTGAAGPGWGLAADAISFAVAGLLRAGMRFPALPSAGSQGAAAGLALLRDLRTGWHEFASRRWLWAIVAQSTIVVAVSAALVDVLGPLVAHDRLGGASAWGFVVAAYAIGAAAGSLAMIRFRPRRILVVAMLALPPYSLLLFALAVPLAVPLDLAVAALAGGCVEVFSVSWATAMQQEIPPEKLSRVSAYDALGNYALTPVGTVAAGPLASAFGAGAVLAAGGALIAILPFLILLIPEVRQLCRE
jgi:MFS family permease